MIIVHIFYEKIIKYLWMLGNLYSMTPPPRRTSIALDEATEKYFDELVKGGESQSSVIRKALKLYHSFKGLEESGLNNVRVYNEMLSSGEHVILDLDHLITLLKIAEASSENAKIWDASHRTVARNHSEQFRGMGVRQILERLEACNFFRLSQSGDSFILVFGSDELKRFTKTFLDEVLRAIHKDCEIKEDLTKLRIVVK